MHQFNYSFLDNGLLPSKVLNLSMGIATLSTMAGVRKMEHERVFTELEFIAKVQSVKNSNEIEGIITSEERVREIVNQNSSPRTHDEAEIAGYRDALDQIHQGYEFIEFSIQDILKLHKIMMHYTGYEFGGKFKEEDNFIMEVDKKGRRKVRFTPTSAKETLEAMQELEMAYREAKSNPNINQLLLIPCVVLDFLCIHPFLDGNGRLSRILSLLLLYKNKFDAGRYVSFEEQINKNKAYYYAALQESSEGWQKNINDYFPFIEHFLTMLYLCYKELDERFATVNGRKLSKTDRIRAMVLESLIPLSKAEICKKLLDISPTTIEAVLGAMVREQEIVRIGQGRATKYVPIRQNNKFLSNN